MTSYLIDINVWIALSWRIHPFSGPAHNWLSSLPNSTSRLLFTRITQLGLLRLLTNEMVMGESLLSLSQALDVYDRWLDDPRVEFAPEPRATELAFRQATRHAAKYAATKFVMDAYLVGFAATEHATLVTFDKALSNLASKSGAPTVLIPTRTV